MAAKYPCGVFLHKNGNLRELGNQGISVFLVADWACYIFVTVNENAFGENKVIELWGNILRSVSRKTESGGGLRETSFYVVPKFCS